MIIPNIWKNKSYVPNHQPANHHPKPFNLSHEFGLVGSSLGTWCLVRAKGLGRFFVGHSFEANLGALGHGYYESRASKDIKGRPLDPVLDDFTGP